MMRIRTIKPEFFTHEGLFEAEKESNLPLRIAFAGLWCAADREGRFKWEPRRLGVQILPYDGTDFSRVLDALRTRGFIRRYRVQDADFGDIPSFSRHQIINNRERDSDLPEYVDTQHIDAWSTREPRDDHASKVERKGREGKGKDEGTREARGPKRDVSSVLSDAEWMQELQADPAYRHLEIFIEHSKMSRWCEQNKKQPNRRRFLNWINRIERPMGGTPPPSAEPTYAPDPPEAFKGEIPLWEMFQRNAAAKELEESAPRPADD